MNAISAHSLTNPFGETSECARFVIDDTTDAFVLSSVATVGEQYTFSFWLRSEAAGNVSVADTNFVSSGTWQKHKITFVAANANLLLTFGTIGTYYLYHAQLELGNMATDWSPAPEDIATDLENSVSVLNETITNQETEILAKAEGITLSHLESYVTKEGEDGFNELKENVAKIEIDAQDGINLVASRVDSVKSETDALHDKYNEVSSALKVEADGVYISKSHNGVESPYKVFIDDNELAILANEKRAIYFEATDDENVGHIPSLNVNERFVLFGLEGKKDENGTVNFVPIGG